MGQKILVIEDDGFLIKAMQSKLTKAGFEVQIAMDGEEGLTLAKIFKPDLIILDLVMPQKDGFEFLEEFKKDPQGKNTPVIIASNLGQKEDIDKGMSLGAVDYIVKSDLSLDDLVNKINQHLKS